MENLSGLDGRECFSAFCSSVDVKDISSKNGWLFLN